MGVPEHIKSAEVFSYKYLRLVSIDVVVLFNRVAHGYRLQVDAFFF